MTLRLFALFIISMPLVLAAGADVAQSKIEQLVQPLQEDRVFFRWQSTESGTNLVNLGVMNAKTNAYFMKLQQGVQAGGGIYMAEGVTSSCSYLPRTGGNIIEIHIPKGTPVIDLTKVDTIAKIKNLDLSVSQILNAINFPKGAMIKYEGDWWVGKDLTRIARFEMFPGKAQTPATIAGHYYKFSKDSLNPAFKQLEEQIRNNRTAMEAIVRSGDFSDALTQKLMTPQQLELAITEHVPKIKNAADARKMMQAFDHNPQFEQWFNRDGEMKRRLQSKLLEYAQPAEYREFAVKRSWEWTYDYIVQLGPRSAAAGAVAQEYFLRHHKAGLSHEDFAKRAAPLAEKMAQNLGAEGDTFDVSASLHKALTDRLHGLRLTLTDVKPLARLAESPLLSTAQRAELSAEIDGTRRVLATYRQVSKTATADNVAKLLSQTRSIEELRALMAVFRFQMRTEGPMAKKKLGEALVAVLKKDPQLLFRHFVDVQAAVIGVQDVSPILRDLGADVAAANAKWIQTAPAELQSKFISACMLDTGCFRKIQDQLPEIVKGMRDLKLVAEGMVHQHKTAWGPETRGLLALERKLVNSISTPEQLTTYLSGRPDLMTSKDVLKKAEGIGLQKFRPAYLHSLLQEQKLSSVQRRLLLSQSIQNAVNAEDILRIQKGISLSGLEKTDLAPVITRRFQEFNPTKEETDSFIKQWSASGYNKILKPVSQFDCVNGWARILEGPKNK